MSGPGEGVELRWPNGQTRLATALASAGSVQEAVDALDRWGRHSAGAPQLAVGFLDVTTGRIEVVYHGSGLSASGRQWAGSDADRPGPLRDAAMGAEPVFLSDVDELGGRYPSLVDDSTVSEVEAAAAIPLRGNDGSVFGALCWAWDEPQPFSLEDVSRLSLIATLASQSLYRLVHRVGGATETETSAEARALQEALLPGMLPSTELLEVAAAYLPANNAPMGGDWYDVFPVDGGSCLVIGDVAGHGLAQAAQMAAIRHAVRAFADEDPDPARVVKRVNRMTCRLYPDTIATMIVAMWDPSTRALNRTNAGHPPLLRCRADEFAYLSPGAAAGPVIGLDAEWHYSSEVKYLRPGTTLVLYTDGLVESRDPRPNLNAEGLLEFAQTLPSLTPRRVIDDLLLWRLSHGPLDDDLCVLAVRLG